MASVEEVRSYYNATLPYYDLSLEDRGDLPFWASMARRWNARRILELGCGTGRVTSVLSTYAWTTAADLLIEMLQRAREHAPRARFVAADLRETSFASKFDLVILADDPMAHLTASEDRLGVLQRVADHLEPDGRLVLDGLYRSPERVSLVAPRAILRDGELLFTIAESWTPAQESSLWNATYRYEMGSTITEVTTVLRSWSSEEIALLPECGLEVEALWGDFDERPFCRASPRMLLVAKRLALPS
jgi:SAM-dependent methyltransferase